jgi:hypothetical protein
MLAAAFAFFTFASAAHADSPLTSVSTGSKTAARLGVSAYTGTPASVAASTSAVKRALRIIEQTRGNAAVGLDAIQRIDSLNMDSPGKSDDLRRGLSALMRSTKDRSEKLRYGLLRGTLTLMRNANDAYGVRQVNAAVKALPGASDVQLVGGLVAAQRASFGSTPASWDQPTARWHEAALRIARAEELEQRAQHPRALVTAGLKSAHEYLGLYAGFTKSEAQLGR